MAPETKSTKVEAAKVAIALPRMYLLKRDESERKISVARLNRGPMYTDEEDVEGVLIADDIVKRYNLN
jgi:hypothetical protein